MSMKNMEELKDMLCEELDEIVKKGEISFADLDSIQKMTSSIKNIDKIIMADRYSYGGSYGDERVYSDGGRGYSMNDGMSYARGGSYANRGKHYVRGHYSYGDEAGMLSDKIEEMINDGRMSSNDKHVLKEALEIIRK